MSNYPIKVVITLILVFSAAIITACSKDDVVIREEWLETDTDYPGESDDNNDMKMEKMIITVGNRTLEVELAENSSVDALVNVLKQATVTVDMNDYGNMEKVGSLGQSFPRNDTNISTQAGDIILYQGNMLVIYYAPNTWNFTRLGRIKDISAQALKDILGNGDVTVVLSLPEE